LKGFDVIGWVYIGGVSVKKKLPAPDNIWQFLKRMIETNHRSSKILCHVTQ